MAEDKPQKDCLQQTAKQQAAQRHRAVGLGVALLCFIIILYAGTLAKLWP